MILTVENLLTDADAIADWHHFGVNDRLMCVLPIHHVNGIVVTLVTPFHCKGSIVLNQKFKSAIFWRRLHEEYVTCVSVVPTFLEFLLDANEDLSPYKLNRFKGFICGAGPLLKETAIRFEDRFHFPIRHGYGLSGTTCYSCFLPNDLSREEHRHWLRDYEFPSIGVPLRHNTMTILDDKGQPLPEMSRGEICIRGGTVCAGYFKRDDANEAAFKWGWFRSGDERFYARDKQGRPFFFISGRLKELIIRGGVNISPLEIDDALKSHPLVHSPWLFRSNTATTGRRLPPTWSRETAPLRPRRRTCLSTAADYSQSLKVPRSFSLGEKFPTPRPANLSAWS